MGVQELFNGEDGWFLAAHEKVTSDYNSSFNNVV